MRAGKTYTCPQCGEQSGHGVSCFRCEILPVDEKGNAPPPLFEREILYRSVPLPAEGEAQGVGEMFAVGGYVFSSLARQIRELRRRRRHRRALATLVSPIEATDSGNVHIRGRVEVLEPARHPLGSLVAAFLYRRREEGRHTDVAIETQIGCGKFLVRDETGAALVDDDFLAIVPAVGAPFPASQPVDVILNDGDMVEVVGPAERRAMPELPQAGRGASFREAPRVLVFDGKPDALLVLRPASTS